VILSPEACQDRFDADLEEEGQTLNTRSLLWVLGGCLALAAGVTAVFALGIPTNTVLLVALVLACPLAHLFMMRSGAHDHSQLSAQRSIRTVNSASAPKEPRG
jgi:Flp pilus assembly protein TadB